MLTAGMLMQARQAEANAYDDLLADIERAIGRMSLEQRIVIARAIDRYAGELRAAVLPCEGCDE